MRKFLICGLTALLLTGCATEKTTVVTTADRMETPQITYLEDKVGDIASQDDNSWQELVDRLYSVINEGEGGSMSENGRGYHSELIGVMGNEGTICIFQAADKDSHQMIETLEEAIGADLSEFIAEGKELESGMAKEKIVGDFGLMIVNNYDEIDLYVTKSGIQLKDQETKKWLQEVCGDQLMLGALSKGDEKELYELSTPGYIIDNSYGYAIFTPMINYQIYRNTDGKIGKVRMVIKTYNNNYYPDSNIGEAGAELFAPLQRMSVDLTESASMQQLIADTLSVAQKKATRVKGKIGSARYTVSSHSLKHDALRLTEVVIE